jgi:hypothetical protein
MSILNLNTPILFLIFNRLNTTKKVFETICQARPLNLYIASDGFRPECQGEMEKVQEIRDYVIDHINWDCEVKTLFREQNLGCRVAVSTAIDWFFHHELEGIILEDDCLPHPSFFLFCQELLEKYRDDNRIMTISGDNFQFGKNRNGNSYYFSRYNHCWGWASWRRTWKYFDIEMEDWPKIRDEGWLKDIFHDSSSVNYWKNVFQSTYEGKINTWDYILAYSCWLQNGLNILPSVNLVSNIGFGEGATHTNNKTNIFANMPVEEIRFPLQHPSFMIRDNIADCSTQKSMYGTKKIMRLKESIKKIIPKSILLSIQLKKINSESSNKTCEEVFSDVYRKSLWGKSEDNYCSGSGSMDKYAIRYKEIIAQMALKHNVQTIVDLGCGDYKIGKFIKLEKIKYIGVDVVKELIQSHQDRYADDWTNFLALNIVNDELPDGDLCLLRQVLQHLSNEQISKIISKVKKYKYCLITEHFPSPSKYKIPNINIAHGADTRVGLGSAVELSKYPFNTKNIVQIDQIELQNSWDTIEPGECLKIFLINNTNSQYF